MKKLPSLILALGFIYLFNPSTVLGATVNTTTVITNAASLSSTPTNSGSSYTVNVSVTRTAFSNSAITGNVTISDGTSNCVDNSASGGNATTTTYSCNLTSSTAGAKTITATYAGNPTYFSSVSAGVPHTVATACTLTSSNSKITNPCLESSLTGNWSGDVSTLVGVGSATTTTDAHSGVRAIKSEITSYTSGDVKWVHLPVTVSAGQYYTFSFWYKSTVATELDIVYNGSTFIFAGNIPAAANWTQYQTGFMIPAGVTSVQLMNILNSVGSATSDDYALITATAPVFPEGRVTLTFDDGWKSFFTNGVPVLNAANIKATAYINTQPMFPSQFSGYMTTADVVTLQNQGHDIGGHTTTHADLTLPATNLTTEINDNRTFLKNLATTSAVDTLAYPYGTYNPTVITAAQSAGYIGARTVDEGFNFTNTDKFKLKIQHVTNVTTPAEAQAWINQAVQDKTWLILMFHEIVPNNGAGGNCTTADLTECASTATLQSIVNSITSSHICVLTMTQALHNISCNKPPVLDPIGTKSITVNSTLTFTAHAVDPDAGNVISYSISGGPVGSAIGSSTGVFTWTPANGAVGSTTVTVTASDGKGGTDFELVPITIQPDTVPPTVVISTTASSTTNISSIPVKVTFSETVTGFTQSDLLITGSTTVNSFSGALKDYTFNLVPGTDGILTVTIAASSSADLAGNPNTVSNTFTVTSDKTKPIITLNGTNPTNITTADTYSEQGGTTNDGSAIVITGSVNVALPGSYQVRYNATDAAGNKATEVVRNVNVSDQSAPVFSNVPADITVEATGPSGATTTYVLPTATDAVSGTVAVTCYPSPSATSTFPLGSNLVSCVAKDSAGNTGTASFSVIVRDTKAPLITPPANQTFDWQDTLTTPNFVLATALDIVDLNPTIIHTPTSFGEGTSTVTWQAVDASGNESALATSTVIILPEPPHEPEFIEPLPPSRGSGGRGGGGGGGGGGSSVNTLTTVPGTTLGTGQVLGASTFHFTLTTRVGSANNEVTELQKRLTTEGIYTGPVTGYFGPLTETGVKAYQVKNGIDPVGIVGPKTRAKLNGDSLTVGPDFSNMTIAEMKSLLQSLQAQLADLMRQISLNH